VTGDWVLLHGGALGDLVLAIQLALRAAPTRRLTVLSRTDPGDLKGCVPAIERRSLEGLSSHWLFATDSGPPPTALRDALAGRPVLNSLGDDSASVHRRLRACGAGSVFSFDPRPRDGAGHVTTQWQRDLERQGLLFGKCIYAGRDATVVTPDAALIRRGRELLRDSGAAGQACVLIHPGSGGREKCWPLDGFIDVAQRLCAARRNVVFVIGPVEQECWPASQIETLRRTHAVCAPLDADELGAILAAGAVLISNDSGPAHLAALLGTPTVTLFGPTQAKKWRPLTSRGVAIQGQPGAGPHWGLSAEEVARAVAPWADAAETGTGQVSQ
jgi:hypothetical protein